MFQVGQSRHSLHSHTGSDLSLQEKRSITCRVGAGNFHFWTGLVKQRKCVSYSHLIRHQISSSHFIPGYKVDHAHCSNIGLHHIHHGHCHPLRLLLRHQAAQRSVGFGRTPWVLRLPSVFSSTLSAVTVAAQAEKESMDAAMTTSAEWMYVCIYPFLYTKHRGSQ